MFVIENFQLLRMPYIVLRCRGCNIFLNVHSISEEKSDDSNDSLYGELKLVFDHFPQYHMKILVQDFSAKVRKENIFNRQLRMRVYIRIVMIMVLE